MKTLHQLNLIFAGLTLCCFSSGQTVTPQEKDGKYDFRFANIYFEVDPSFGARISSFKIDSEEILFQSTSAGDYLWGSTLWQSPQSEWNWPPSVALDQSPYSGGITGNQIILRSSVDETYSHLVFKKTFSADLSDTSITMVYTMINKGTTAHSYAAWEVSRVPAGGISFFPKGEGNIEGNLAGQTELINNVVWYEQNNSDPAGQKFMCDGAEGWSAHVNSDAKLFVKKFDDAPATSNAPGEKEIELYYSGPTGYIELENQSAYTNIPVGDSVSWTMKWYLRDLPSGIQAQAGSSNLVSYVRSIVKNSTSSVIDNVLTDEINLYPNPANDYVMIKNLPAGTANFMISDICGRIFRKIEVENNEQVPLTGLKTGLYFYRIEGSNIRKSGKLVIRK